MDKDEGTNILKEEEDMAIVTKGPRYKGLSLTPQKLKEITIEPKVKDGKLLFDKNNKHHRYIVED